MPLRAEQSTEEMNTQPPAVPEHAASQAISDWGWTRDPIWFPDQRKFDHPHADLPLIVPLDDAYRVEFFTFCRAFAEAVVIAPLSKQSE